MLLGCGRPFVSRTLLLDFHNVEVNCLPLTFTAPVYHMVKIQQVTAYMDSNPQANNSDPNHIYRQPPSPEVDAAWEKIAAANGIYPMSEEEVTRAGKDPDLAVDAPEYWNFPPERSKMMGIEAFHQLHCLSMFNLTR